MNFAFTYIYSDIFDMGSILSHSIKRHHKNSKIIQISDQKTKKIPLADFVERFSFNKPQFIFDSMKSKREILNKYGPTVFLDADMFLLDSIDEFFIYEHFEIDHDIRRLWPYQGDNIIQGRWGNSIRLGSHITPGSHGDDTEKPDSPNILLRTGQLVDASKFGKDGIVQDLINSPKKPVEEDINSDGSSIWMTTDQSVKLDIRNTNALSHDYMTSLQSDDQPKNGGKQIVINSDRITFNSKEGKILGFSHDGIGFSTQKSFSVDADDGMKMNSGGATSMDMVPGGISLITPGNSRLDLGGGGEEGGADKIYLSSECPSFLSLDDKAHLESCDGAIVHLDDCAGMKDNQGSFLRIGGKALGITGYVKERDDMGQQHLVYGEALTDILDELITSILNITAIPTGAGPSGPISATPSFADFESIRAKLCDLLMKPE